jgi:hypothetical protein
LKIGGLAIADVDHAGVLAGAADHPGGLVGSFFRWMRLDL